MRLNGKIALITGASRNIGRAIALAFASEGADLVLNTRVNDDELATVAADCRKAGVRALPAPAAIRDASPVAVTGPRGLAELGPLAVAVSHAPTRPQGIPLRRLGRSEDMADACVFLASEASSYVTGDTIRVMGGRVIG